MGSSTNKKLLALVKWVGGDDDKQYTCGIDITHIKDFNCERFSSDEEDPDRIYVVEWRDSRKKPLGGWKCYSAKVIAVSGSVVTLNKKLKALDGIQSPKRIEHGMIEETEPSKISEQVNKRKNEDNDCVEVFSDADLEDCPISKRKKLFETTHDASSILDDSDDLQNQNENNEDNSQKSNVPTVSKANQKMKTSNSLKIQNINELLPSSSSTHQETEVEIIGTTNANPDSSQYVTKKELEQALTSAMKNVLSAFSSTSFGNLSESANTKKKLIDRVKEKW